MNKNNFVIKKQPTNNQTKQRLTCHFQIQFRHTKWSMYTYFQSRRNMLREIYISFGLNWRCKAIVGCCCSIPLSVKRMTAKIKGTRIEFFHSRGQHNYKQICRDTNMAAVTSCENTLYLQFARFQAFSRVSFDLIQSTNSTPLIHSFVV